jgi:hypothetical protein
VYYLEMSVESDSPAVLVAGCERYEEDDLREGGTRGDGAAFAGLHSSDMTRELGVHHGHLAVLDRIHLSDNSH